MQEIPALLARGDGGLRREHRGGVEVLGHAVLGLAVMAAATRTNEC